MAHRREGAEGAAAEVGREGRKAEVRRVDVTDLAAAADQVSEIVEALGGLDAFVNNAGTGISKPFLEQTYDDWRRVLEVDLDAPFVLGQRAATLMRDAGGAIRDS